MKKYKTVEKIRVALLCLCTVLMFELNLQLAEISELATGIYEILENLRMSLNSNFFQMTIVFGAFYYVNIKINSYVKERVPGIVALNLMFAVVWLMAENFRINNTTSLLFCSLGQGVKSIIYLIGATHLLNILSALIYQLFTSENAKTSYLNDSYKCVRFFEKHSFAVFVVLLLMAWLPHTIISYPANIEYDVWDSVMQYNGDLTFTAHHPPVYTVGVGWFTKLGVFLGDINIGLFVYILIQTVIAAMIMAYALIAMKLLKTPAWLIWGTFITVAITPYYTGYVTTIIKDTPYAFATMLFFIELLYFEVLKKTFFEKIGHIVLLVISVLGMTLIRYNGKYVVISLVLYYFGVFLYRKGKKEYGHLLKVCILMVVTLCISTGVSEFAIKHYNVLEQEKESIREALSLPFQQTARYVNQYADELTEEEIQVIDKVLPYEGLAESYNPMISDTVKARFRSIATYEEILEYFEVWFKCFLKHPFVYLQATLNQNYYVLYPMQENLRIYDSAYVPYFWNTEYLDQIGIEKDMAYERANDCRVSWYKLLGVAPITGALSSLAVYVIVFLYLIAFAIYKKMWKFMWIIIPEMVNVLIIIAGPVIFENIRYALPVVYTMPVVIAYFVYAYRCEFYSANEM